MTIPTLTSLSTLRSIRSTSRSIPGLALLAALATLAAGAHPAAAATRTWTGAGGNNQWMTAANWQGGVAPVAGDDLMFPVGGAQTTNVNNFPAGTTFGSITFVMAYTVGGNAFAMTGTLAVNSAASPTVTLGMPVAIASASDLTVNVFGTSTLELGGALSGNAGLTKIGNGTLRLIGTTSNTYTGLTSVNEGTLVLGRMLPAISIPAGLTVGNTNGGLLADVVRLETSEQIAGTITMTGSGWLDLANMNQSVSTTLIVRGGRITTGAGLLTLNANISVPAGSNAGTIEGQVSLGGATRTLDISGITIPALDIKANVADGGGTAGLIKTGSGWMRLSGANIYTGVTTLESGMMMAAHPQALGSPAAGTVIEPDATLVVDSNLPAEPIIANGDDVSNAIYCSTAGTFSVGGTVMLIGEPDIVAGSGCHLVFDGPLSGSASKATLITFAPASFTLNAINTFTGITCVNGNVFLGVNDALAASSIVHVNGGVLDFKNHSQTMKYLTGGGDVLLGTATLTIDAPQNAIGFDGMISGTGGVVKKGVGTWYLSGANTYTGSTVVQGGVLSVPGSIVSPVTFDGGTLQGSGTVGATGTFFETFILIANTYSEPVEATLTFLPASGAPVEKKKMVPARGRITVNVETEDPSLTDGAVATKVTSFAPTLIVERAQYWPSTPALWHESHNSFGVTAPGTRWGLAEGRAGGPENYQTYLLLANPGTMDAEATVMFLRESGAPFSKKIAVPAQTRVNLSVGANSDVPELANERFGAVITSDQPVVVERAMFWDANGVFWSAGTNATATRLP